MSLHKPGRALFNILYSYKDHYTRIVISLLIFTHLFDSTHSSQIHNSKIQKNESHVDQPVCHSLNDLMSSFHNSKGYNSSAQYFKIEKLTPTTELKICSSFSTPNATCCSKEIEEILMNESVQKFRRALSSQVSPLRRVLAEFRDKYTGLLASHRDTVNKKTVSRLRNEFGSPRLAEIAASELTLNKDGADHEGFLAAIFPAVLYHVIATSSAAPNAANRTTDHDSADFEHGFRSCLTRTVWPWIRSSRRYDQQLHLDMGAAILNDFTRSGLAFLRPLVGREALNDTLGSLPLSPDCGWSLTKMYHCQSCALDLDGTVEEGGELVDGDHRSGNHSNDQDLDPIAPAAPICRGLCWNVARGCLAHLDRMGTAFHDYVKLYKATIHNFQQDQNQRKQRGRSQQLLAAGPTTSSAGLDQVVADMVMWALENGPALYANVTKMCGEPKMVYISPTGNRSATTATVSHSPTFGKHETSSIHALEPNLGESSATALQSMMQEFTMELDTKWNSLNNGRPSFSFIPDQICSTDPYVSSSNKNCWDGDLVGRYSRNIVKFGANSLRNNPEILESDSQGDEQMIAITQYIKELKSKLEKHQKPISTTMYPSLVKTTTEYGMVGPRAVNEVGRLIDGDNPYDGAHHHFSSSSSGSSNRRSIVSRPSGPVDQDGGGSGHMPPQFRSSSNQRSASSPSISEDDEDISGPGSGHYAGGRAMADDSLGSGNTGEVGSQKYTPPNKSVNGKTVGEEIVGHPRQTQDSRKPYDFKDDLEIDRHNANKNKYSKSTPSSAITIKHSKCMMVIYLVISMACVF